MRVTITVTAAQLKTYLGRGRQTGGALVRELGLTSRGRPISHIYISPVARTLLRCLEWVPYIMGASQGGSAGNKHTRGMRWKLTTDQGRVPLTR